jgi:hypothetical protein
MKKTMERRGQLEKEMILADVSTAQELAHECRARGSEEC